MGTDRHNHGETGEGDKMYTLPAVGPLSHILCCVLWVDNFLCMGRKDEIIFAHFLKFLVMQESSNLNPLIFQIWKLQISDCLLLG